MIMTKNKKNEKASQASPNIFPYSQFPVKVVHKEGKDLSDTKICYFQSELHAKTYITKCKFKKKDYQMFIKTENKK